jgi:hypothetical protein
MKEENIFSINGMFYTPKNVDELMSWCENYSGSERIIAMTAMGMTWNLCSEIYAEHASNNINAPE